MAAYQFQPDGANTSDICKYTLATAILTQNATAITEASNILSRLIKIETANKSDGIQPDYSFSQHVDHGRQLNMASYGKEFMGGLITFFPLPSGTFFEISAQKMTIFENLMLHGRS